MCVLMCDVYMYVFVYSVLYSVLYCIDNDIVCSLSIVESRSILLHSLLRHLKFHINERKEVQKKLARDDSLDKTLEISGNLLMLLHSQTLV